MDTLELGTLESVELAGRTAYKSEDRITSGSAVRFVDAILKRGHESVIEHYPLVFKTPNVRGVVLDQVREIMEETIGLHYTVQSGWCYISMNARTLRDAKRRVDNQLTRRLLHCAYLRDPALFRDLPSMESVSDTVMPSEKEIMSLMVPAEAAKHVYRMVRFITDRGVSHELVRHRLCAITQESTRYCNYVNGGVTFIKPVFWGLSDSTAYLYEDWHIAMKIAEKHYLDLVRLGASPQEARSVLPNSLKTEIVVTANLREWRHIMTLRSTKAAHPQMRDLMLSLLGEFKAQAPDIFAGVEVD